MELPKLPPRGYGSDPGLTTVSALMFGWQPSRYDGPMPAVLILRTLTPPVPILDETTGERVPGRYWPPYIVVAKQSEENVQHVEAIIEWLDSHRTLISRHRLEAKKVNDSDYEFFVGDERGMTLDKRAANACRFRLKFLFDERPIPFAVEKYAGERLWLPLIKTGDVIPTSPDTPPLPPPAPHPHEDDLVTFISSLGPPPPLMIPLRDGDAVRAYVIETRIAGKPKRDLTPAQARTLVDILNDPASYGGAECGCIMNGCRFVITTDRTIEVAYDPLSGHISGGEDRIMSRKGQHRLAPFCK